MSRQTQSGRTKFWLLAAALAAMLTLPACESMPRITLAVSMPAFGTLGVTLGPGSSEIQTNGASGTLTNAPQATSRH